jgi:N utilization substance protein B
MTRDPKSGGKGGGPGAGRTGAAKTPAGKPPLGKMSTAKTSTTKTPTARKPVTDTSVTMIPETETPSAGKVPAAKHPSATKKTPAKRSGPARSGAAKSGAAKVSAPRNGSHKGDSPKNNGKAEAAAGLPRKANKRGAARLHAVQALYQMDMTGAGLNEILAQFESHWLGREVEGEQYLPAEAAFFRDIVSGVVGVQRDLDPRIDAALEATWPLKRIEAILRSVLRAGAYELQKRTDIPARVVVSEYVDVAHAFVDKTETGMVNAVLDRLARNVRAGEFG